MEDVIEAARKAHCYDFIMKVLGITAEYNPFHNGHLYQLQKTREMTGADFVIIVMSGDFMQRGTPALFDKYLRCRAPWRRRSGD